MRFCHWFAAFCGTVAILLGQETEAARLDAVKDFQHYFKKVKTEAEQVEAVMMLRNNECTPAAEELLRLLKHPVAAVQQAAFTVLESYKDPATFKPWLDSIAAVKDDERAILIKVFGGSGFSAALPAVVAAAQNPKASPAVHFEAARALAKLGNATVAPALQALLADGDPLVRMAATDSVRELKLVDLGAKVVPLLQDPEWQVQAAAVAAVAVLRPQEAVQPLIDLMRKSGRLQTECSEALFRITGFDFGLEPDRWQEQWNNLMAIPGWRIPTAEELAKKAASRKKYEELYGKKAGASNTFAGIPTTSTRVLFIIDVSGSMDDLVVEREKFQGYADLKKLTVVKTELLHTIETLTQDTLFDIVAFATDLNVWKKRLVPANVINRMAAKDWVERLKPLGGTEDQELAASGLTGLTNLGAGKTNTLKALLYPFGIDPDNPPKAVFTGADRASVKNKIDTVYFLSDGRPSIGKIIDTIEILKEVRRYNETFRIVFHAIAIGEFQKEFLRDLATQNGGVFVDLGR